MGRPTDSPAEAKPGDALLRIPLTMGTAAIVIAGGMTVAGFAWSSAVRLTQIEARLETQGAQIHSAVTSGREQREAVARASMERHQQQQQEIDRLRLDQQTTAAFIAETRAKLDGVFQAIQRIEGWLRPSDPARR